MWLGRTRGKMQIVGLKNRRNWWAKNRGGYFYAFSIQFGMKFGVGQKRHFKFQFKAFELSLMKKKWKRWKYFWRHSKMNENRWKILKLLSHFPPEIGLLWMKNFVCQWGKMGGKTMHSQIWIRLLFIAKLTFKKWKTSHKSSHFLRQFYDK